MGVNFEAIAELITEKRLRCYNCGTTAQEVDHVLPIAMAWVCEIDPYEVDEYCAPICKSCHLEKTKLDIRDIRSLRRQLWTASAVTHPEG